MLKLYNTLTKKKEIFKPLHEDEIRMYNCGPTVYDYAHIGNYSTYIMADLLRRYLEYKNYKVKQVMNITDVGHLTSDSDTGEDKIIKGAKREKKTPMEIIEFYTNAFFEDINKLNIKRADRYPKASEHIEEMIELIKKLLKKGFAYEINGTVYYDISKFKNYGKLSGNTLKKLKEKVRKEIVQDESKKNPFDFVLWFKAPKNHLMQWDSPWGKGYPGWHIECSAMSMKYLGPTLDIHTGGEDNIFPHHENEIAQSEAATGKKFVRYWLHRKHLLIDAKKMAKSEGNFYILRDLEKQGYDPLVFRFLVLNNHYRTNLDFNEKAMAQSKESLERIREFFYKIESSFGKKFEYKKVNPEIKKLLDETKNKFEEHMNYDLNSPKAISSIFDFIKQGNKLKINSDDADYIYKMLLDIDSVLGVIREPQKTLELPVEEIETLISEREEARQKEDFERADEIREKLKSLGIQVKDTDEGTKWRKV